MTDRVVDIGERPARLTVRHSRLVVEPEGGDPAAIPIADIGVLLLSHPAAIIGASVLTELAAAGASVVISGRDHLPAAMLLPLLTHSVQSERHARQVALSAPARNRLWRQIVRAKIQAQARALISRNGEDAGLAAMAARVRSGDPDNLEAQAARRYWPLIFGDPRFRRGSEYGGRNAQLNYGYAVLRAGVARALCAAGLHPSLGLQHHNRYDPFRLASDLMEPFRPLVDRRVAELDAPDPAEPNSSLDATGKSLLLEFWRRRYRCENEQRTLADLLQRAAHSLAAVIGRDSRKLLLPEAEPISQPLPNERTIARPKPPARADATPGAAAAGA